MDNANQKRVLFYGAGEHAALIYRHACRKSAPYGEPVAFIDRDPYKQGHELFRLPIISWEDAQKRYGEDFYIYITSNEKVTPEILGFLQESGITPERIINYEPVEKRMGCGVAEAFFSPRPIGNKMGFFACDTSASNLSFQSAGGELDVFYLCAEDAVRGANIHTAVKFMWERAERIAGENARAPHSKCVNRRVQYLFKDRKIRTVNFAGTGPCNFKCSYCLYNHNDFQPITYRQYPVLAEILLRLEENGYIDENTVIKMSNGEFSINEEGNHLAELSGKYPLMVFTNAYIFSPQAAKAIENSGMILCSVDAGTRETFHTVKGVDGFDCVSKNLKEYAKHGPVALKYILLDGENDTETDLEGFFNLADEVAVRVDLTRDFMDSTTRFSDHTLEFAARFIKHFRNNGKLNMSMSAFVRSGEGERLNKFLEEV